MRVVSKNVRVAIRARLLASMLNFFQDTVIISPENDADTGEFQCQDIQG